MTELEHMMLFECFCCVIGTWLGIVLSCLFIFISSKIKTHRAKKLNEKELGELEASK